MLHILKNNCDYIHEHRFQSWDFHVFHLNSHHKSDSSANINLIEWIDHPFIYICSRELVFGYLPSEPTIAWMNSRQHVRVISTITT